MSKDLQPQPQQDFMQEPVFSSPSAHALERPLTAWHGCQWHVLREWPFHFTCILWGIVERVEPPLKQAAGSSNSYQGWRVSAELLHPSARLLWGITV